MGCEEGGAVLWVWEWEWFLIWVGYMISEGGAMFLLCRERGIYIYRVEWLRAV